MNRHLKKRAHVKRGASSGPPLAGRWRGHLTLWGVVTLLIAFLFMGNVYAFQVESVNPSPTGEFSTMFLCDGEGNNCAGGYHSSYLKNKIHTGIDFRKGNEIVAALPGVVAAIPETNITCSVFDYPEGDSKRNACKGWHGLGNAVALKHILADGRRVYSMYGHLRHQQDNNQAGGLENGDYVYSGQLLGYQGNTGYSKGAHLHFEISNEITASSTLNCNVHWIPACQKQKDGTFVRTTLATGSSIVENPLPFVNREKRVLLPYLSWQENPSSGNYSVFGYANKPLYGSLTLNRVNEADFYKVGILAEKTNSLNRKKYYDMDTDDAKWLAISQNPDPNGVERNKMTIGANTLIYGDHEYKEEGIYAFSASVQKNNNGEEIKGYPILFNVLQENELIVDNDQPPPLIGLGPLPKGYTEFTAPSKYHSTVPGYFLSAGLIKGQSDKVAKWNPKRRGVFQIVVYIPAGATADSVRYKIVTKKDNGDIKKIYVTNPINHNDEGWQPLSVTEDGNEIEHFFFGKNDYVSLHVNVNYVAGDWGGIGENNTNKGITTNQYVAIDAIKFKGGLDSDGNDDLEKIHTGLGVTDDVARAVYRNYMTEGPNSIETNQANETLSVEHDSNNNLSRYTLNDSVITISWTDGAVEGAASTDDDTDEGETNTDDNSDDNTSDDPDSDGNDANTDDNTDDNVSDDTNSDDSDGNDANTDDSTDDNVSDDVDSDNSDSDDNDANTDNTDGDDGNVNDDTTNSTKEGSSDVDTGVCWRSADPENKYLNYQGDSPVRINTPELRDGNASHNLSPAEIISYSATENAINPLLLLTKLQQEQSLLTQGKDYSNEAGDFESRLLKATGVGVNDGGAISKWFGFYPQTVAASYEWHMSRSGNQTLAEAMKEYTSNPDAYQQLVDLYANYAEKINGIAGTTYATHPPTSGYYNDFTDITAEHIQSFLELDEFSGGALSQKDLFREAPIENSQVDYACDDSNTTPVEVNEPAPSITVHTENGNIQISGADLGTNGTITVDGKTVQRPGQGYWTDEGVTLFKETLENLEQPVQIKLVNDKGNEFNICYPFVDVCPDTWYAPPIITLWKKGIVNGYGGDWQGYFRPHNPPVTRAEFVTTTVRAFDPNVQPMSIANSSFSDIQGDDWYAPYVEYAKDIGIISGCETDKFCPNKPISRPAGVKVVVEAFLKGTLTKFKLGQKPESLFLDVTDPSQWYYHYIYAAQAEKIIKGYPDGSFKLDRDMTRAEMAKVICLAFAKVDKETQPSDCADDIDEIAGLPFIVAVTPETATLNESTVFTVTGRNLREGMVFELADCADVMPIAGGTAEKRFFQCTPSNTGVKKGTLQHNLLYVPGNFSVNVQGEVTPKVTSISPTTATLDQSTTFTVVGSDLPDNLTFEIANCTGVKAINRSLEQQQFQCTPTINGGSQEGTVKDESGAKLKVFFIDVVAPVSETPIEPPSTTEPPKKVFKVHKVTNPNGSTKTVSTFHPSGSIDGSVALESGTLDLKGQTLVIYGNLIHSGGTLKVNGGTLIVEGDYRIQKTDGKGGYIQSTGYLHMTKASDKVQVLGDFIMDSSNSHFRLFAAGNLDIKGDFQQKSTNNSTSARDNFFASGSHTVTLSGIKTQTVSFEDPHSSDSHFNKLVITNPVVGGIVFLPETTTSDITYPAQDFVVDNWRIKLMPFTLGKDMTIRVDTEGAVHLEGQTLNLNGQTLRIKGDLIHSGGTLRVNGGTLIVEGDYRIQKTDGKGGYIQSTGYLHMTKASDKVQVLGDFIMDSSNSHFRLFAAGNLDIKGDFQQKSTNNSTSARDNFFASGSHTVTLSGTKTQTVSFEDPNSSDSHFYMLEIANTSADGIAFNSKIVVTKLFDHHRKPFTLAQTSQFPDYDADTQKDNVDPYPKDPTNTGIVDNSGVLVDIQDAAPNHGDGNGDGILDSEQLNVVSLPNAVDNAYLTLAVNGDGCPIENVEVKGETEYGELDKDYDFPQGLIGFELPCDSANVTVFYHDVDDTNDRAYRKYGPTTPGNVSTTDWYTLSNVSFDTMTIAGQTVATASFTLHDNQLGDDTGKDGIIVDDGGLAIVAEPQDETVGEDEPVVDDAVVEVDLDRITSASCQVYAVNDKGLNNSQFFTINLDDHKVSELGPLYKGHDIEALAIHPVTNLIYAASGNDVAVGNPKGHLYLLEGETGELFPVGSTGFKEIGDLAFSPDGTLWAWAKGDGMITLDPTTGIGTLVIPSDVLVEGLTLSKEQGRTVFYGSVNTALWVYDMDAETLEVACTNLLGETEALEMMPDGLLLMGIDKDKSFSLHAFDAKACEVVIEADMPTNQFDDVEGIALPVQACAL